MAVFRVKDSVIFELIRNGGAEVGAYYLSNTMGTFLSDEKGRLEKLHNADQVPYEINGKEVITIKQKIDEVTGGENLLDRINSIELQIKSEDAVNKYKELIYSGDDLIQQDIYEDSSKEVKLYEIRYISEADDLVQILVIRMADLFSYAKTLSYGATGDLIGIDIT